MKREMEKEIQLDSSTASVFSGRSILGNMKMKFEDVEIDPLKTVSAYLPLGKSYSPRVIHTPLLRLLVYICYYKSNIYIVYIIVYIYCNIYNICGF